MRGRFGRWMWLAALVVAGCDDGGGGGGAAPVADAATPDGARPDAASPDAAMPDAALPDARVPDAAPPDAASPDAAAPDAAVPDGATPDAALPDAATPDAAPPPDAAPAGSPCTPCAAPGDCAASGPGAQCSTLLGGGFCTATCGADGACDPGYRCVFGQCLPAGFRCDACAVRPCAEDRRCNLDTGTCDPRVRRCGACGTDDDCEQGLGCRPLGLGRSCLPGCDDDGGCPDGFRCDLGLCVPNAGFCDNCGGCGGDRPVCNFLTGMCLACGPGFPCPDGALCDEAGECVALPDGVECRTDLDCREAGRPFCVEGACMACRADVECAANERCDGGACVLDPCARLACQTGAACDAAEARCEGPGGAPACVADADCGDGHRCNPATGQCFRDDQRCDGGEAADPAAPSLGVCAPGGACIADPLDGSRTLCTCARTNPQDAMEPNEAHRIPCQPGGLCVQLGAQPGFCVRAP